MIMMFSKRATILPKSEMMMISVKRKKFTMLFNSLLFCTLLLFIVKFNGVNAANHNYNYNYNNINNNNNNHINLPKVQNSNFNKSSSSSSSSSLPYQNNNYNNNNYYQKNPNLCTTDRLVSYKVILHTYWTRELFPKHYPDWRPPAQWTKTIGRSHDSTFSLFHLGQTASEAVKEFAETGKTDVLEMQKSSSSSSVSGSQSQSSLSSKGSLQSKLHAERSILDEFNIAAITTGGGQNEANFFVDSNHSLVSLMTRIVPSPDWFIGIDSFQLCIGDTWIDTVTVEMDPLDAGTDNGFTFTAPNWPTEPQGVIYRITSRYPAHPAGSFFYPKSKRLPPIATFQFIKLKEYELSEVFNFHIDERKYETLKTQTRLEWERNHIEMNNELSASIEKERQNEVTAVPVSITEKDRIRAKLLEKMKPSNMTNSIPDFNDLPRNNNNNKDIILNNISTNYRKRKHRKRLIRPPRDCRVSDWSEWSPCSKTCGIGEMQRHRKVTKHAKYGGRPCPPLRESKWCGSAKGCHSPSNYFNWSNT